MNTSYPQSAQAIRSQQQRLAEIIVQRQYALQSQAWQPLGAPGMSKSLRDAGYHLDYLAEALAAGAPALFIEYLAWVRTLFAGLGFAADVLPTSLELTRQALSELLAPEDGRPALEYLASGLASLNITPATPASFIPDDAPFSDLARAYLAALLDGDRRAAGALIMQAVQAGAPVKDIYLHVFQPSQREIGRLWQTNHISVAQEHFCTAATQMVMSQLYPYIFTGERKNRRLIVCCVGGELHEIGARMVADFFEMSGWDTYFLGANTPLESILRTLEERRADILALSATMTFHVSTVAEIIAAIRQKSAVRVRVLVGGYPFNLSAGLWQQVGADGYALDAQAALGEAERMLLE